MVNRGLNRDSVTGALLSIYFFVKLFLPLVHILYYRGAYMSAHLLLNLLNEMGIKDKMRGLPSTFFSQRV